MYKVRNDENGAVVVVQLANHSFCVAVAGISDNLLALGWME